MNYCYSTTALHRRHTIPEIYLNQILMHVTGLYHARDDANDHVDDLDTLGMQDPFAASIKRMVRSAGWVALKDKTPYKTLFLAIICEELKTIRAAVDAITTGTSSVPLPIQPMTVLAIQRASPFIFSYCISHGAIWDPDVKKAWDGDSPTYAKARAHIVYGMKVPATTFNGVNTNSGVKALNAAYSADGSEDPRDGLGSSAMREEMEQAMPPGWRDVVSVPVFEKGVRGDEREIGQGSWEFGNPWEPEGEDWFG